MSSKGRVTLPAEEGLGEDLFSLAEKWGADAVRDSDGTKVPEEIKSIADKMYSKLFFTRGDQVWAEANQDELQRTYILSEAVIAKSNQVQVPIMTGFFKEQLKPDTDYDPKVWWEVINRTTGEIVPTENWSYNAKNETVIIKQAEAYHRYTVTFLAKQLWDPVHMYNHITNDWDTPHQMPYDPRYPKTKKYILDRLKTWLDERPDTDVVRITTFFYNFTLLFNDEGKEKYVDWLGYNATISPLAITEFEKEYGYRPRPEDFVDKGYYNTQFRNPSKVFLDWIDFQHKFVSELAKECVDIIHSYGKEAMMFLGDHWAGTEPYGEYFKNIGLDAIVGSVGDGPTLRMISDVPHVKYSEGRFLPYFFPDTFHEGGDPTAEANENWLSARRAILRSPIDRMGYGGYPSLALKFPDFVKRVTEITQEFREIHEASQNTPSYKAPFKVAILNAWGHQRRWMSHHVHHAIWYKQCYSYYGMLESLSGLALDIEFISFNDIKTKGIADDIGVIINAGDAYTSWSGGENWLESEVVTTLRSWIDKGGGFIGVGQPTAYEHEGQFFQLSDVLGVQQEKGFSLSLDKYNDPAIEQHFILQDKMTEIDYGEGSPYIYQTDKSLEVLDTVEGDITLAANKYGQGRAVYAAGLPFNTQNTRMLERMIYWAANAEAQFDIWQTDNLETECAVYPEVGKLVIINNSYEKQETVVTKENGEKIAVSLEGMASQWINL